MLARMLLIGLLVLGGCGGEATFDAPLTYVRGGGETGEARVLTVRPDGTGSIQVERGISEPVRVSLRLTGEERERLARLVGAVDLGEIEEDGSEPMPDAYSYSVSLGEDEAAWQAMYIPPELQALWAELEALAEKYGP